MRRNGRTRKRMQCLYRFKLIVCDTLRRDGMQNAFGKFIRIRCGGDHCGRTVARFGFICGINIQRYRREKEAVTRIAEEPWHFRYVGVPHALLMEQNRLCLEEYVPFLQSGVKVYRLSNGRTARVSWLPCPGEEIQTEVPEGCWQVSGDNQGGFILTLWEGGL